MATTGKVNGTLITLHVGGTEIACLTSNSISFAHSPRETTNKDSGGWKEVSTGLNSWSMSGEGYFAEDATYGFTDLQALILARGVVTVLESSEVIGDKTYSGSAYITALERTSPLEETVTFSVTLEGTGVPVTGTVV